MITSLFDLSEGKIGRDRRTKLGQSSSTWGSLETGSSKPEPSRRRFLKKTAAVALVGSGMAAGTELATPRPLLAQSTLSPEAALKELMDGDRRFTSVRLTSDAHDLEILRQHTAEKQEPFAAVLSCADSRVPSSWSSIKASAMSL
jgi:carbonic anhydrase